jgi:hypothetical protein
MGCDLIYSNRTLVQLRTGKQGCCRVWYVNTTPECSKAPISIRTSIGPNRWSSSYLFPPKGTRDLTVNKYYSVEGEDSRYLFVDSIGDAWLFKSLIDFEAAIANYGRQGPSFHLKDATHYSQVSLPKRQNLIASRYERILGNKVFEPTPAENPQVDDERVTESYDEIQNILNFEFNRPSPPKIKDPLGLDFEDLIKQALEES